MRPIAIALTLVVLTTACETTTDPFLIGIGGGAGGPLTQAQATGNWTFTLTKTSALTCAVGALADGSRVTMHLDVQTGGTVNGATSSWQTSTVAFPLSGSVTLSTGATDLFLSGGSGSLTGMELIGTITATGSFSGTLHDPGAGFTPMFSTSGCVYSAPGTKA